MKLWSFILGLTGGALNAAFAAAIMVAGITTENTTQGVLGFILLLMALFLLRLAFRAREDERLVSAVWSIICGALLLAVFTAYFMIVLSFQKTYGEDVFFGLTGVICALLTVAGGILAVITRKTKFPFDGNGKSKGANIHKARKVTAVVFGFMGGSINAFIGICGWIELRKALIRISDGHAYIPVLFAIMLMLLSFLAAVVLLCNRLQGGVLLIVSGGLVLLLLSVSMFEAMDAMGTIAAIAQLFVLTGGILGLTGYKKGTPAVPAAE